MKAYVLASGSEGNSTFFSPQQSIQQSIQQEQQLSQQHELLIRSRVGSTS